MWPVRVPSRHYSLWICSSRAAGNGTTPRARARGYHRNAQGYGRPCLTGKPFLLGQKNFSLKTTVLASKGDRATLRLLTDGEGAPLSVEPNSDRVDHLNVDLLDGESALDLGPRGIRVRLAPTTQDTRVAYNLPVELGFSGVFASYSVLVETTGSSVFCAWEGPQFGRGDGVATGGGRFSVSGSVIVNGDEDPRFYCETQPGETISVVAGSSISALRLFDGTDATVQPRDPADGGFPFRTGNRW